MVLTGPFLSNLIALEARYSAKRAARKAFQRVLNAKHERIVELVGMYMSGVMLMPEFAQAIASVAGDDKLINLTGLIDPASGLRYIAADAVTADR